MDFAFHNKGRSFTSVNDGKEAVGLAIEREPYGIGSG